MRPPAAQRIFCAAAMLGLLACGGLTGCTTTSEADDLETYRAQQAAGGTLPWNRPASWEGPASMGGVNLNQFQ